MRKFRPFQEPIRLQDLFNSARSRAQKKINQFTCPGCNSSHIGKTNRTLSAHKNMRSRTKKARYISICAIMIRSNTYKVYTTYQTFLSMRTTHLLLHWRAKNFSPKSLRGNTNTTDRDDNYIEILQWYITIPCICCLSYRHNAITRYHIYSIPFKNYQQVMDFWGRHGTQNYLWLLTGPFNIWKTPTS